METGLAGMPMAGHPGETSSPGEVYFDHYFHDTPSMPEHEHFTGSSTDHAQIARYEGAVGNHPHFEHALHDDARHGITQSPSEQSHLSFNSVGLSALSSGIPSSPSTDSHLTYRKRGRSVKKASSPRPRKKKSKSKKAPSPPRQALHNQGKLEVEFYAAAERDQGGLDALVLDWTQQETHSGRRVVAFWRLPEQLTHTPKMRVQYRSLAQSNTGMCTQEQPHRQQQQQYAAVSCVYWPERKEHYITSVDIVTLIEFLMQCQFTVEEKNRVRRNLEGFQPTTVSKCKRATEEFFKRIMRFDAPRPRNIEKDIKVYPWLTLTQAIIKVVSKLHDTVRPTPQRRMLPVPEADKEGLQHISTTQESSDSRDSGEEQHLESV
ncbi:hypothetical protein BCR43DRAFT_236141 [Syncephalastrum racemosum]|uniref:DUF7082 domain-containing protein n=1 Tax=Syncephalastrum racemosum TaxID=13706 RepID=A0A1X2HEI1_SYNRA|nr:hypothetical protein BCR43DRAFT_236141 [Syncephalastrum racemosum]